MLGAASIAVAISLFSKRSIKGRRRVGSALPQQDGCIYLDYAATCPIYPDCADAMLPYLYAHWGNPSSAHAYGAPCREAVQVARERVRALINARLVSEIVWCSCGSEADNWAIVGALECTGRSHVVVSSIEHPAILACVDALEAAGKCEVTRVGCDSTGVVSAAAVARAVRPGETALVSVMLANNEVGSVQDLAAIVKAVKAVDAKTLVHTDAAQAVGKIDVDVLALGVDALTLVGHKFGAPKGVAALYVRDGLRLPNMLHGGGQENGRRAGTEAVPSIVALGEAAAVWLEQGCAIQAHSTAMRDRLRARLEQRLSDDVTSVNGPLGVGATALALPNVLSFAVDGARASEVLATLRGSVAASASAACHSGSTSISSVLAAVGVPTSIAIGTLRLSVGRHTTSREVDKAADLIVEALRNCRNSV